MAAPRSSSIPDDRQVRVQEACQLLESLGIVPDDRNALVLLGLLLLEPEQAWSDARAGTRAPSELVHFAESVYGMEQDFLREKEVDMIAIAFCNRRISEKVRSSDGSVRYQATSLGLALAQAYKSAHWHDVLTKFQSELRYAGKSSDSSAPTPNEIVQTAENGEPVDAFILFNERESAVESIVLELERRGVKTYFWRRDIPIGGQWEAVESSRMQSARSVVVFLGDAGWGPTHIRLAKESLNFNGRVIPVLLGRVSESELDTLPELFRERRYFEVRQFAASEYDSLAAAIKGQPLEPTSEDSLRDTAAESAADGESRYAFKRTLPAFSSDLVPIFERSGSSKLQDALGVHVYADHLAQLIAAKSTPLPLAIGLFGAWGSGKSHFMGLLQDRLNEIYRPDLKEIFHEKIIQIRFNAWHYLDTNLWANLVCEIFDQLFAALEEPDGNAAAKKIELLKEQLKEKSVLHAEAKAALTAAEAARKDAQEALVVFCLS